MTVPDVKQRWIEIFARLLAENTSHEIGHALLGLRVGPGGHNNPDINFDIMNRDSLRTFVHRSGIEIINVGSFPNDPASFRDGGIAAMSHFLAADRGKLDNIVPVPPVFH